jgi:hypothetical protein
MGHIDAQPGELSECFSRSVRESRGQTSFEPSHSAKNSKQELNWLSIQFKNRDRDLSLP